MKVIRYAGQTDTGRVRTENEDRWFADPERGLFLVSDGIGGAFAGGLASRIVVETLPPLLHEGMARIKAIGSSKAKECVKAALCELSNRLFQQARNQAGLAGMGATVAMALMRGSQALIAHMGDSRAYLYRNALFLQLTRDHSLVQLLVDNDEIRPEDAATHPAHGQITRYVGMEGDPLPDVRLVKLRSGDRLLLCTDGLTAMLSDHQILSILANNREADAACHQLVDAANEAGGKDNITVVLIAVGAS
jgi:protein phosphatase